GFIKNVLGNTFNYYLMGLILNTGQLEIGRIIVEEGKPLFKVHILFGVVKEPYVYTNTQPVLRRVLLGGGGHWGYSVFHDFTFIEQIPVGLNKVQTGLVQYQILEGQGKIPIHSRFKGRSRILGGIVLKIIDLKGLCRTYITSGKVIYATTGNTGYQNKY